MDPLLRDGFDLVILDVKMPGLDGTDVIKMIRTLCTGHVCGMFYSSSDSTELRRLADAHGAQGYLTKTATMTELEFRVRALLGEARTPRKAQSLTRCMFHARHSLVMGKTSGRRQSGRPWLRRRRSPRPGAPNSLRFAANDVLGSPP